MVRSSYRMCKVDFESCFEFTFTIQHLLARNWNNQKLQMLKICLDLLKYVMHHTPHELAKMWV